MKQEQLQKWLSQKTKQSFSLEKNHLGLSNDTYICRTEHETYFIRTPRFNHELLDVRFQDEKQILDLVKELDVPLVYFDIHLGIKITRQIPDAMTYQMCKLPEKAQKVGSILKKLHQTKSVDFYFDPFKKLSSYRMKVTSFFIQFPKEEKIVEAVKKLYTPNTLCHNDVVDGNLLFTNNHLYLIDYEYASMNDFRFDLASFLSENNIKDKKERDSFFEGYGISDPQLKQEVLLFECFEDILWGYWAMMLYESSKQEIYKTIAKEKEAHYQKILSQAIPD
ncbi:hypothetical protein C815_02196 [Firmicutes bacterium M10-2]|nr:hypothetical protein C815_02196 [Firmicutes bacterium M10-2]